MNVKVVEQVVCPASYRGLREMERGTGLTVADLRSIGSISARNNETSTWRYFGERTLKARNRPDHAFDAFHLFLS